MGEPVTRKLLEGIWDADQNVRGKDGLFEKRAAKESALADILIKKGIPLESERGLKLHKRLIEKPFEAKVDASNFERLEAILKERGWPNPKSRGDDGEILGEKASQAVFLVLQHLPLTEEGAQKRTEYWPHIKEAHEKGFISGGEYALYADRFQMQIDGTQIYGSQSLTNTKTGRTLFEPIRDVATVDARRKKMGMEPLAAYAQKLGISETPRDGGPLANTEKGPLADADFLAMAQRQSGSQTEKRNPAALAVSQVSLKRSSKEAPAKGVETRTAGQGKR